MYLILWKTASFTKWLQGLTGMFIWKQFETVVLYKSTVGVSSYPSVLHLPKQGLLSKPTRGEYWGDLFEPLFFCPVGSRMTQVFSE